MDRGAGDSGAADPPEIPVDIRNLAVLLEAQRYAFPTEVWDVRLGCAAEYFCVSDCSAFDFTDHRSAVSGQPGSMGISRAAHYANTANVDHGRRAAVCGVLSWIFDY